MFKILGLNFSLKFNLKFNFASVSVGLSSVYVLPERLSFSKEEREILFRILTEFCQPWGIEFLYWKKEALLAKLIKPIKPIKPIFKFGLIKKEKIKRFNKILGKSLGESLPKGCNNALVLNQWMNELQMMLRSSPEIKILNQARVEKNLPTVDLIWIE